MIKQALSYAINRLFLSHSAGVVLDEMRSSEIIKIQLISSSENVLLCDFSDGQKYVRIIRKHSLLKTYLSETVDLFFDFIAQQADLEQFRKKAHNDLTAEGNYRKAIAAVEKCQQNVRAVASGEYTQIEEFGFPSLRDEAFLPFVCRFILFLRGELLSFQSNRNVRRNAPQTFSANLQCATKALADLLGLGLLVPAVEPAVIRYRDRSFLATVMDPARGVAANQVGMEQRQKLSAEFIKDLTNLEFFDAICYQTDHKQRNFNAVLNEDGNLSGVSAFDNDAPFTFLPIPGFPRKVSLIGQYQVVYDRRRIRRGFVDAAFASRLNEIKKVELEHTLSRYLTAGQIHAVWYRIKALRRGITCAAKNDAAFLVAFPSEALPDELIERYSICGGNDYLHSYLTFDEQKAYAHIKVQ